MFQKLQTKWKVNGWSLTLILITFALGGSLCGFIGKKIMNLLGLEKGILWVILYVIILTIIWPLCVLLISIPMGQFHFFKKYIAKILSRFGGSSKKQAGITRLAIFASGTGSNAKKIIEHFQDKPDVVITTIVSNKPAAPVLEIARTAGISTLVIDKPTFENSEIYIEQLKAAGVDIIVLAGFLWKVPPAFVRHWPGKILNLHPALLPAHGGKGMYGDKVHQAVLAAGDRESGISIHLVDELYDHGAVIFQARCPVDALDSPQTLAKKIHALEHAHFPVVIDDFIKKQKGS